MGYSNIQAVLVRKYRAWLSGKDQLDRQINKIEKANLTLEEKRERVARVQDLLTSVETIMSEVAPSWNKSGVKPAQRHTMSLPFEDGEVTRWSLDAMREAPDSLRTPSFVSNQRRRPTGGVFLRPSRIGRDPVAAKTAHRKKRGAEMIDVRKWHWVEIASSDTAEVLARQRRQWKEPQTMWPAATHIVRIVTTCGRHLQAGAGAGNPALAATPEAEQRLQPGSRIRIALDGDRIVAIGHDRVLNHSAQDGILAAHGIDVAASHAWARELDWWNDDSPNALAEHASPLAYVLADGRFTAGFAIRNGNPTKLSKAQLPDDADYAYHEGELLVRGIPHTMATVLRGRRLLTVLSAPALDPLDLRIHAVRMEDDVTALRVVPRAGWTSLV